MIDETPYTLGDIPHAGLAPNVLDAARQPDPTRPSAPPKPPAPRTAPLKLPVGHVIRAKFKDAGNWIWYTGSVVGHRYPSADRIHHEIKWADQRWEGMEQWRFFDLSAKNPLWQSVGNVTVMVYQLLKLM